MNRTLIIVTLLFVVFVIASVITAGQEPPARMTINNETEIRLSPHIKKILSAEMNGIQKGMTVLAIAVPAGHWDEIVQTAGQMKDSYIMNRKLSAKEMEELHHSLPAGFQKLDREFHDTADLLKQAAGEHDKEKVTTYLCRLNQTCIQCHSAYAAERFPGLRKDSDRN
ncbi:MAG: cytochrome c [Nitrospirota bacterium]